MSGQFGFQATDPMPPPTGWTFDAEDIDELGLPLCIRVAERMRDAESSREQEQKP